MSVVVFWDNWHFSIGPDGEFAKYIAWIGPFVFLWGVPE